MRHFDKNKISTQLTVDASLVGLNAVLTQTDLSEVIHPVAYASRTLLSVEKRYSYMEKEAFAVVWYRV